MFNLTPAMSQSALMPMQGPWNGPGLLRMYGGTPGSSAWTAANRAIYLPFAVSVATLVKRLWIAVGTTGGTNSVDLGIYDSAGNRVISHGGATVGTASTIQFLDVTDTWLAAGAYYMAGAMNGTTATCLRETFSNDWGKIAGVLMQETAYALPSTMTPITPAINAIPIMGLCTTASP